jgi:hypothetical protein
MLDAVRAAGIPAVVCTTASNESGLMPLGEGTEAAARFAQAIKQAASGDRAAARESFLAARDLDTMPWRPISATEDAIRRTARARSAGNVVFCDVAEIFRGLSPAAATGWELLDDHVHLTLRGQAEVARAIVTSMTGMAEPTAELPELLCVEPARAESLPEWKAYAERLGTNEWDDYRVNHTLRVLFGVPFMKRTNLPAFERFESACQQAEARMTPAIRDEARQWQSFRPHAGGLRPLTGMVARVLLRENKMAEAERLFAIAQRQVPDYTSWYLEYLYFKLVCRERINAGLSPAELDEARHGIDQGQFLLRQGFSQTGLTERYVGRLHQLRGEWKESIEPLRAARSRLAGTDLVACDQALVQAYVETGDEASARAIIAEGIRGAGRLAPAYKTLEAQLPAAK